MRVYEDSLGRLEDRIKKLQADDESEEKAFLHFKAEKEVDWDTQQNRIVELTKLNEILLKRVDELNETAQIKTNEKETLLFEIEALKNDTNKIEEAKFKLEKRCGEISFTTQRGNSYNKFKMNLCSNGSISYNKM